MSSHTTISEPHQHIILVLGGYGNFGKRIVQYLCNQPNVTILVAGRSITKAQQLVVTLEPTVQATTLLKAVALDINAPTFATELKQLKPTITIHTSGPFQGQDYRVPLACINAGCHYIDLADDRPFVCNINTLDTLAKTNNVLVVSGASSVPGLSSTVIDHYKTQFSSINTIDMAIAPGNQAERGEATVKGILSYIGKPFSAFIQGKWTSIYGWMDTRKLLLGDRLGSRLLANVDIPDLSLFPTRYQAKTVRFQAGLELPLLHHTMRFMALLSRYHIINNWLPLTSLIMKISHLFDNFGTDNGGMQIHITGLNAQQKPHQIKWTLYAENGIGPYIPTFSAIIVAQKLIKNQLNATGALPCLGLYTLDEFAQLAQAHEIYFKEES